MPSSIKYDHEIDITKYLSFNYGRKVKYRIMSVCSHYGISGSFGHYIAYCRDKINSKWYQFNDSIISECDANQIRYGGTPYLLLYERID
jgi:ubiquitin carboxyl-terminal hydrolase 4/11/15